MAAFQTPVDIANKALQFCGTPKLTTFSDQSAQAFEINLAYDKVRQFELQRNMWTFSTRRCVLRPLSTASVSVTFPAWSSSTTYANGFIVTYGNLIWYSTVDGNVG